MSYHLFQHDEQGNGIKVGQFNGIKAGEETNLHALTEEQARKNFYGLVNELGGNGYYGTYLLVEENEAFEGAGDGRYSVLEAIDAGTEPEAETEN